MQPPSGFYTPPSIRMLRWLTESHPAASPGLRLRLLNELFIPRKAVVVGAANGLVMNGIAIAITHQVSFVVLLAIDALFSLLRLLVLQSIESARARHRETPTDIYLVLTILRNAFQGALSFLCWRSGDLTLQLLSATTVVGWLGALGMHHYMAPRLAIFLMSLCAVPFVLGGVASGDPWLLLLLLQIPLLLYSYVAIAKRTRSMALLALQSEEDSERRAHHDPLTGLLNRAGLSASMQAIGTPASCRLGVFYVDLDGFKAVNDSLGHHAGDRLLEQAARRLLSVVRPGDFIARAGGDEFIVMTRGMASIEAEACARRLVDCVSAAAYRLDVEAAGEEARSEDADRTVRIGASVGFACAPEDGDDMEELCRHADIALYRAKRAGRGVQRRFAA